MQQGNESTLFFHESHFQFHCFACPDLSLSFVVCETWRRLKANPKEALVRRFPKLGQDQESRTSDVGGRPGCDLDHVAGCSR